MTQFRQKNWLIHLKIDLLKRLLITITEPLILLINVTEQSNN